MILHVYKYYPIDIQKNSIYLIFDFSLFKLLKFMIIVSDSILLSKFNCFYLIFVFRLIKCSNFKLFHSTIHYLLKIPMQYSHSFNFKILYPKYYSIKQFHIKYLLNLILFPFN